MVGVITVYPSSSFGGFECGWNLFKVLHTRIMLINAPPRSLSPEMDLVLFLGVVMPLEVWL